MHIARTRQAAIESEVKSHCGVPSLTCQKETAVDDRIWGAALAAIGVAMIPLHPWSQRLDGWLKGLPRDVMTAILVLLAIIIVSIAFSARPAIKALLILWIVMP
jgi:hypothetical protein